MVNREQSACALRKAIASTPIAIVTVSAVTTGGMLVVGTLSDPPQPLRTATLKRVTTRLPICKR
jgi:hypothetical protein